MTIEAKVVGIRIWTNNKRNVSMEWFDPKTEDDPYPQGHSFDVVDNDTQFDLGDVVQLTLTKIGSARTALSIK
jgi:hypothetical protein